MYICTTCMPDAHLRPEEGVGSPRTYHKILICFSGGCGFHFNIPLWRREGTKGQSSCLVSTPRINGVCHLVQDWFYFQDSLGIKSRPAIMVSWEGACTRADSPKLGFQILNLRSVLFYYYSNKLCVFLLLEIDFPLIYQFFPSQFLPTFFPLV